MLRRLNKKGFAMFIPNLVAIGILIIILAVFPLAVYLMPDMEVDIKSMKSSSQREGDLNMLFGLLAKEKDGKTLMDFLMLDEREIIELEGFLDRKVVFKKITHSDQKIVNYVFLEPKDMLPYDTLKISFKGVNSETVEIDFLNKEFGQNLIKKFLMGDNK